MFSWLQCETHAKTVTKLLSKEKLSLMDRMRFYFHNTICLSCGRYYQQASLIQKACDHLLDDESVNESRRGCLCDEAKSKMANAIEEELAKQSP